MSNPHASQSSFDTVLVGVDGREGGRDAIALAAALMEPGGRMILAAVVRPHGAARPAALFADADRRAAAKMLEAARQQLSMPTETVVVTRSSISEGLHSIAKEHEADLLVLGSTRHGAVGRVMLGDDARQTLDAARCAVAVAPHGAHARSRWRTIAVGDDGSPESALALASARHLAARIGARLRVWAVVGPAALTFGELSRMDTSAALARRTFAERKRISQYPDVEVEVLQGDPGETLCELGEEVDLLVIGSRGEGAWGRLMTGSTGNYLARHAPCPVLILPRTLIPSGALAPDGSPPGPPGRPFARAGRTSRTR